MVSKKLQRKGFQKKEMRNVNIMVNKEIKINFSRTFIIML